jgi:hypothetical protein
MVHMTDIERSLAADAQRTAVYAQEYQTLTQAILAITGHGKVKASALPPFSWKDLQQVRDLVTRMAALIAREDQEKEARRRADQRRLGTAPGTSPRQGTSLPVRQVTSLPDPAALYAFRAATYEQYRSGAR